MAFVALLVALTSWTAQAQDDDLGRLFVSVGVTGYVIAPFSGRDHPHDITYAPELHRHASFMARAAKTHTVGMALDFVGVDIPDKWRRLMALYGTKDVLVRFQTGRVTGKVDGNRFAGPYWSGMAVAYTPTGLAFGVGYTSLARPVVTFRDEFSDFGGYETAVDPRAHAEILGLMMYSDRMFESMRDGSLSGPGMEKIGPNSAFAVDFIALVGASTASHSLAFTERIRNDTGESPLTRFGSLATESQARMYVLFVSDKSPLAGSAGMFVKFASWGSGGERDAVFDPGLELEFHLGPMLRIGGQF